MVFGSDWEDDLNSDAGGVRSYGRFYDPLAGYADEATPEAAAAGAYAVFEQTSGANDIEIHFQDCFYPDNRAGVLAFEL